VLQKAELSCEADSENNLGGSSETMYYIGLDVHKRMISYCVKLGDVGGNREGRPLPRVRCDLHDRRRTSSRWGLVATLRCGPSLDELTDEYRREDAGR
jgi:hypothetical protein